MKVASGLRRLAGGALLLGATALPVGAQAAPGTTEAAPPGGGPERAGLFSTIAAQVNLEEALGEMATRVVGDDVLSRLGITEGCDYQQYLELMTNAANRDVGVRSLLDQNGPGGRNGLPTLDILRMITQIGATMGTTQAAAAERSGTIEQIEQICQNGVQADEVRRHLMLGRMQRQGTAGDIAGTIGEVRLEKVDTSAQRGTIERRWDSTYTRAVTLGGTPGDALWRAADTVMAGNLKASRQLYARLSEAERGLERGYGALFEYPDEEGICDNGDPVPQGAPRHRPPGRMDAAPTCGPAAPERIVQARGQMELIKVQARTIRLLAAIRYSQVQIVGLQTDAYGGRTREAVNLTSQLAY